ncbi:MAG: polysulfide reductase NrfD [Magnetococcales bacterium]|nr:polysulfide reductase NrfD [Magnetococcales bacterium]
MLWGFLGYRTQLATGLAVSGLSDQVPWGLYVGNFLFLVGIAASAIILTAAVQWLHRHDLAPALIPAKLLAIVSVFMSLLFILADLGHPERIWHALPVIGGLHFPTSILAWDILALSSYLILNIAAVFYHHRRQKHSPPDHPASTNLEAGAAFLLGLSIHTTTAFILAGLPARPLWNSAILAPKFIISAFAAGSAMMFLLFKISEIHFSLALPASLYRFLSRTLVVTLLGYFFLLGSELFVDLYSPAYHSRSAVHLYLGKTPHAFWTDWIYLALGMITLATVLLLHPRLKIRPFFQYMAALSVLFGVWMEKGLGLLMPGLVPTPLGEWAPYHPTGVEIRTSLAIYALGAWLLTLLLRKFLWQHQLSLPAVTASTPPLDLHH